MKVLVTGAASSGKSAWAEARALSLAPPRLYVATMAPAGREAAERIRRHRALRAGKGFSTVELFPEPGAGERDVGPTLDAARAGGGTALVEDLGNLVANRLFSTDGTEVPAREALLRAWEDLACVCARYDNVVFVGNEVGADGLVPDVPLFRDSDGRPWGPRADPGLATARYVRVLGTLACWVATGCDEVVEVVSSAPNYLKGGDGSGLA